MNSLAFWLIAGSALALCAILALDAYRKARMRRAIMRGIHPVDALADFAGIPRDDPSLELHRRICDEPFVPKQFRDQ